MCYACKEIHTRQCCCIVCSLYSVPTSLVIVTLSHWLAVPARDTILLWQLLANKPINHVSLLCRMLTTARERGRLMSASKVRLTCASDRCEVIIPASLSVLTWSGQVDYSMQSVSLPIDAACAEYVCILPRAMARQTEFYSQ